MVGKTPEPLYHPAELSAAQMRRAIPRLEKRIEDLEALNFSQMKERGGPEIVALQRAARLASESQSKRLCNT
ncbi:hypothetical protein [Bradyrhizobium embrapense]